jgi:hypothetical protein
MPNSISIFVFSPNPTQNYVLKDVYSDSSYPLEQKMSLKLYMKVLEQELDEESIERLQKKEKESEDFRNSLELFSQTFIPSLWPLSGFESYVYNSSYPLPYSNFLELNSASHVMYVPYFSCDELSICVQKGFLTDTLIGNPHYLEETCFIYMESHAHLPIRSRVLRQTQWKHPSKLERRAYWDSRNGIGKKKRLFTRPSAPPVVHGPQSSLPPFNLVSYLFETFIVDDIFSDLLH